MAAQAMKVTSSPRPEALSGLERKRRRSGSMFETASSIRLSKGSEMSAHRAVDSYPSLDDLDDNLLSVILNHPNLSAKDKASIKSVNTRFNETTVLATPSVLAEIFGIESSSPRSAFDALLRYSKRDQDTGRFQFIWKAIQDPQRNSIYSMNKDQQLALAYTAIKEGRADVLSTLKVRELAYLKSFSEMMILYLQRKRSSDLQQNYILKRYLLMHPENKDEIADFLRAQDLLEAYPVADMDVEDLRLLLDDGGDVNLVLEHPASLKTLLERIATSTSALSDLRILNLLIDRGLDLERLKMIVEDANSILQNAISSLVMSTMKAAIFENSREAIMSFLSRKVEKMIAVVQIRQGVPVSYELSEASTERTHRFKLSVVLGKDVIAQKPPRTRRTISLHFKTQETDASAAILDEYLVFVNLLYDLGLRLPVTYSIQASLVDDIPAQDQGSSSHKRITVTYCN